MVVTPISHTLANREAISIDDLEQETVLLLGKGNCFRDQVLAACPVLQQQKNLDDLQRTLESGSIETIRHMVASGVGITILPCTAAGAEEYSRRLLAVKRFADIQPNREVILAWRRGFPRVQAIDAVVEAVQSCPMSCVEMTESGIPATIDS